VVDRLGALTVVIFSIVVFAASATGIVLLAAPGETDRYFSWTLRPRAAAAMIGGLYLASAILFGWGLVIPRRQARPLLAAILGLSIPTLVLTFIHDEVFDFSRWQAVAWVVLFVSAPVSAVATVVSTAPDGAATARLRMWARLVIGMLALAFMAVAIMVWFDTTRSDVARYAPFALVRLTGTYLGAWCSFLGLAAAWAAVRGGWDDARAPLVAIALASAGANFALLRTASDIRHRALTVFVTAALGALAIVIYWVERPHPARS
jgi:hypothetical protein